MNAEQRKQASEEREAHRKSLEEKHGMTGHHKAADVYALAWSYGHSSGFNEVGIYYGDLASLVKP